MNRYTNSKPWFIQTEAERRRREAGVKQSMEIRVRSCMYICMYVCMFVWYLRLSREPQHLAKQMRYHSVGISLAHCLGTIKTFLVWRCARAARICQILDRH